MPPPEALLAEVAGAIWNVSNSIPPRPVRLQGLGCRTSGIEFRVWVAQTVCLGACEPAFRCVMNTINPRTQAPGLSSFHFHVWERHGSRSQELVWERHIVLAVLPAIFSISENASFADCLQRGSQDGKVHSESVHHNRCGGG